MVLPNRGSGRSGPSSSSSSSSKTTSNLLKKQPRPAKNQPTLTSFQVAGSSSTNGASSSRAPLRPARLRQASIFDMAAVVDYGAEAEAMPGVATTLYLGDEDLQRLKATLEDQMSGREDLLRVLRRLSAVPCTRSMLEHTRIGVVVGHLRKHADVEVSDLAGRIVGVWKRQVKEERQQMQQPAKR